MIAENLFEEVIYPNSKAYVEAHSLYDVTVSKKRPLTSKIFPIAPMQLITTRNEFTTLTYGEIRYPFTITIDVYAMDKVIKNDLIAKEKICDEITKHFVDYFNNNMKVTITINNDAPNSDNNIYRNQIVVSGVVDTKYGNNNPIVYPS